MRRMSPREMRRLMKKLGMQLEELSDVEEVIIVRERELIKLTSPTVSLMKIGGQTIFQVVGEPITTPREETEKKEAIEIPEEDVQLVAAQAGVSIEEARRALMEAEGDLAKAILTLTSMKK
ncbi:MAG: nascent polypeptide-associated complex protein [Candidatus Methanomethylicota archaeon]|nr:MAG: nascent polypeptide-associated complex protein [Candidatus Verstraetearchaeota archaeon]